MIPSAFVLLDALPVTPNGKVDRRALPTPDDLRSDLEVAYVAPETDVERMVGKVWQEALHVDRVGIHDNFFDLGGHSLLFAQVQSKLQRALGKKVSMVEMFQFPTVASLAEHLSQSTAPRPTFAEAVDRARRQRETMKWHNHLRSERDATGEREEYDL